MKKVDRVRIGLLPVRRGMGFSQTADVLRVKREAFEALARVEGPVEWVNLDEVIPDGVAAAADQIPAHCGTPEGCRCGRAVCDPL